ncbi:MAG: VanW family protein [Pseudobutyrivibrio sp.]|nr:VanW family protein [Pseudobutyrivibrio sp.]
MERLLKNKKRIIASILCICLAFAFVPSVEVKAAANDNIQAVAAVFDEAYYAAMYPDVAAKANGSPLYLLNHYANCGIYEGRNASATFNATDYKTKNPDLVALYGDNLIAYVYHYVNMGAAEGRDATPTVGGGVEVPRQLKLLGVYATEYDPTAARATNITIAAGNVNGTVVAPGKTFSANNAIGPRTTANGYVTAPVFINKEHAMGLGGGICQVSSTIYSAMRMAGIPATERHAHSLPVNYLPAGWDATISWGSLDMKFANRYDKNIVIYMNANNGILTAALYLQN